MNRNSDNQWVNVFEVKETYTDPKKGHTVYKVISRLFPKNSIESVSEIVVWKRFNDFKQLHKALSRLHQSLHLKGTFPKLPESKIFGRFNDEVIEERKKAALQLLEFASKHSPLLTSSVFVKFFENAKVNVDTESANLQKPLEPRKLSESESFFSLKSDCSEGSNSDVSPQFSRSVSQTDKLCSLQDLQTFDPLKSNKENENSWESADNSWLLVVDSSINSNNVNKYGNSGSILHLPSPFSDFPQLTISSECKNEEVVEVQTDSNGNDERYLSETSKSFTSNDTYLVDAATLISQAQQHENNQEFEAAFESYKCAVGILLQGVKCEGDDEKRELVRRKTIKYLARAEEISEKYLDNKSGVCGKWAPDSPYKLMSHSITPMKGEKSIQYLRHLKVVDVIGNVQLVKNMVTNDKCVVKVYRKRVNGNLSPLFPTDVPNMVKLFKVYETDYAFFLLLQYASGGRLWDMVYNEGYRKLSPCADCTLCCLLNAEEASFTLTSSRSLFSVSQDSREGDQFEESGNLSKLESYCGSISSIDSIQSFEMDSCESYVDLCKRYADSKFDAENKEQGDSNSGPLNADYKDCNETVINTKHRDTQNVSNPVQSQRFKFSVSLESFGINNLLRKAKVMLKNADETFRTKQEYKQCHNERPTLKLSKSEMNLSKPKRNQISEVFHQFENNRFQQNYSLDEEKVRKWLLQIITALDHLHALGIYYIDLNPDNILVGDNSEQILLTYKCKVEEKDLNYTYLSSHSPYIAPEVYSNGSPINHQVDWWSLGVIAYELLTSRSFRSYYPKGASENSEFIYFPLSLSPEAKDLIIEVNPKLRLGRYGIEDIKTHPFFLKLE